MTKRVFEDHTACYFNKDTDDVIGVTEDGVVKVLRHTGELDTLNEVHLSELVNFSDAVTRVRIGTAFTVKDTIMPSIEKAINGQLITLLDTFFSQGARVERINASMFHLHTNDSRDPPLRFSLQGSKVITITFISGSPATSVDLNVETMDAALREMIIDTLFPFTDAATSVNETICALIDAQYSSAFLVAPKCLSPVWSIHYSRTRIVIYGNGNTACSFAVPRSSLTASLQSTLRSLTDLDKLFTDVVPLLAAFTDAGDLEPTHGNFIRLLRETMLLLLPADRHNEFPVIKELFKA